MCLAPRGCAFEQDCTLCEDPDNRSKWGCDEPTAEPLFWIEPCPMCAGNRSDCEHCKGSNRVPMHRCPNVLATARERDLVAAALQVENGLLPDPGGWQDQAATFVQAYPLLAQEIAQWRERIHDQAMRAAKARR